jgi:Transglycosylase SLT domain
MKKLYSLFVVVVSMLLASTSAFANSVEEWPVKKKKETLTKIALEEGIPPEVLKAIAYSETGMNQFNENGEPFITDDGGIGIMQITMSEEEMAKKGVDRQSLLYDTEYNMRWGAKILKEKWNYSFIPKINDHNPQMLEHWYFAVMAYNGLSKKNDPNHSSKTYQDQVFQYIRNWADERIAAIPSFETAYSENGSLIFPTKQYQWDQANTKSMQMLKKGDILYTRDLTANLRNGPDTVNTTVISKIEPYSKVEILEGPYESEKLENFFVFYKVKVNGKEGYMASINLQDKLPSLTIPHVTLPPNHREPVARLIIRNDVPIVKKNNDGSYTLFRTAKKEEMLRLYGTEGIYYNVGGSYFVKHDPKRMSVMIGRLNIKQTAQMYKLENGKLIPASVFGKGHNLRVYDYDDDYYYVGGQYVVKKDRNVVFYKGFVKIYQSTYLYGPNGEKARALKPGEQYRVYDIDGNKLNVGNGYYIVNEKAKVKYLPH